MSRLSGLGQLKKGKDLGINRVRHILVPRLVAEHYFVTLPKRKFHVGNKKHGINSVQFVH